MPMLYPSVTVQFSTLLIFIVKVWFAAHLHLMMEAKYTQIYIKKNPWIPGNYTQRETMGILSLLFFFTF